MEKKSTTAGVECDPQGSVRRFCGDCYGQRKNNL